MTCLATVLAIAALYRGAGAIKRLPHLLSSVVGTRRVAPEQVSLKLFFAAVMTARQAIAGVALTVCIGIKNAYRKQVSM